MKRRLHRLSVKQVENLKRSGYWCDGGGLYLQVSPARTKSWVFRFTLDGRTREMGLGGLQDVSLSDARRKASGARKLLVDAIDPIVDRDARRAQAKAVVMTFEEAAGAYIDAHQAAWRNEKHRKQWRSTLATYAYPTIGNVPINAISTEDVLSVLKPIWTAKTETASRVRQRLELVLDWGRAMGFRTEENPARWRGHLQNLLPAPAKIKRVEHHAAMPHRDIGAFIESLRKEDGVAARALEFLVLTATRTSEVIGARFEEFDLDERTWVIPANRMKSAREHRVPLCERAVEIVRSQPQGAFVFAGQRKGRPLSKTALWALLKTMGYECTAHGFRSSFRTWAGETTNFPREVCEAALAHVLTDKTEAAYQRGDLFTKRAKLMNAWSQYCDTPATGGKVVVRMRKARG
jgi:integrase